MAMEGASTSQHDQPPGMRRPAYARATYVVGWLLAVMVAVQPLLAGLFLDGHDTWRDWHRVNGMLIPLVALVQLVLAVLGWRQGHWPGWPAIASAGLLVTVVLQMVVGQTSLLAVHIPLGVAVVGLTATLLARTRTLSRPPTDPRRRAAGRTAY